MALTDRQYYHIFRTPSFSTSIGRSARDITTYNVSAGTLTGDKILIAAPGAGKQIILLSISCRQNTSGTKLGTGAAGADTVMYVAEGGVSFPSGFAIAENSQVSSNASSGFLTITYIVADL